MKLEVVGHPPKDVSNVLLLLGILDPGQLFLVLLTHPVQERDVSLGANRKIPVLLEQICGLALQLEKEIKSLLADLFVYAVTRRCVVEALEIRGGKRFLNFELLFRPL